MIGLGSDKNRIRRFVSASMLSFICPCNLSMSYRLLRKDAVYAKLLTRMMMGLMFCVFLFGMDGAHGQDGDKVLQVSNNKEG